MKTKELNQSSVPIIILLLLVTGAVMLIPTDGLLYSLLKSEFKAEYVGLTLKMSAIFLIGYSLIRKLKLSKLAGLDSATPWRFKSLNLIPVYLFLIGILSFLSNDIKGISISNVGVLFIGCLMVGFAEEYVFRGALQSIILRRYASRNKGVFLSIAMSSLLFGAFHLLNLTKNDNLGQVLVQVVYATFIGFFFGALLLKTNKLIPIAITHGLINFFFSLSFLPAIEATETEMVNTVSLAPIILTMPLLICGLLIYRKLDKKRLLLNQNIKRLWV